MSTTTQTIVNGVNVTGLTATIDAIQQTPSLGRCEFRVTNRWLSGAHNRASAQGFLAAGAEDTSRAEPFTYDADEPPVLEGENRGANPVEFALTALSGCLTTTLVYYAAIMGVELKSVASRLEGDLDVRGLFDLDAGTRNGFSAIRVTYEIDSDAPREKIEELVQIAQRFSPVFDIVSNPVPVEVKLAD